MEEGTSTECHGQEMEIPIVYTVEIHNWGGMLYIGVRISPSSVAALRFGKID